MGIGRPNDFHKKGNFVNFGIIQALENLHIVTRL